MVCINVLVVSDDAQVLRRNIHAVLAQPSLRLTGAVSDGRAARAVLEVTTPDVLLVDCQWSGNEGIELVRHAVQHHPRCAALLVTRRGQGDDCAAAALAAGAASRLSRRASPRRIEASIHAAHADGLRSTLAVQGHPPPRRRALTARPAAAPVWLTTRETEILRLVEKGLPFDTVSELLDISPHTVVAHLRKIYRKLAVHTRGEAVHEASQMGLL